MWNFTTKAAILVCLLFPFTASAQLQVKVHEPKQTGSKVVIKLGMQNTFAENIESARATIFLFDDQGKMAGQATQWVIGGTKERPALAPGKETTFNFVITTDKPFKERRVTFTRIILEGGKSVDPTKNVVLVQ